MIIGNRKFEQNQFYIMGILNVTPDSFSDGGRYATLDKAMYQTERMVKEGASLIDVGGESTRPGYVPISVEEEIQRVSPVIEGIRERFDIFVSLDSSKSKVVEAVAPHIHLANDIYGLKSDAVMADVIARYHLSCCLMHNRKERDYKEFWLEVQKDLQESIEIAEKAGISKDRIMVDPGVGFAKDYSQNLMCINRVGELKQWGCPVMMATSNKGFIGQVTGAEVGSRTHGTVATTVTAALNGATFFRVHDVKANREALDMVKSILEERVVNREM